MFTSSYRKFFVLLSLFAVAVATGAYVRLHRAVADTRGAGIAGALSVEKSGSGLAVSWNSAAPIFHNARNVTLEIDDGGERRNIPLNRSERVSTLYYSPREADVTLRLRIQPADAGEPEKIEVIRIGSQKAERVASAPKRTEAAPSAPDEGS